jgi:hypothetical protein
MSKGQGGFSHYQVHTQAQQVAEVVFKLHEAEQPGSLMKADEQIEVAFWTGLAMHIGAE